jgi:hypothetical protein
VLSVYTPDVVGYLANSSMEWENIVQHITSQEEAVDFLDNLQFKVHHWLFAVVGEAFSRRPPSDSLRRLAPFQPRLGGLACLGDLGRRATHGRSSTLNCVCAKQ